MLRTITTALLMLAACSAEDPTREALQSAGFTEIQVTGWRPLTCAQDDTFSTGFIAKNPQGRKVKGVVCCGLVAKNCTVRF